MNLKQHNSREVICAFLQSPRCEIAGLPISRLGMWKLI